MKKLLYILAIVGLSFTAYSQTSDKNYVKSTSYQVATVDGNVSDDNKLESVTYFDGLGRPVEVISARAGGTRENIVQYTEYDYSGVPSRGYLPWASGDNASDMEYIQLGTLRDTIYNFYNTSKYQNTPNPYSEINYERSPLFRPKEQGAPGTDWQIDFENDSDHTIKFEYGANDVADNLHDFSVSFVGGNTKVPLLTYNGTYGLGIFKTVTKDENWTSGDDHTTQEFKNNQGQVLLKRSFNNEIAHDTYYVYDDFGNLTYVLSPEASEQIVSGSNLVTNSDQILDDLGYQYKYDDRNRLIEKKIPGKGWEYIVYDRLDRVIMTQDANLRANSQWLFTKYDKYSRIIFTGIYSNASQDKSEEQQQPETQIFNEQRLDTPIDIGGTMIYYTNNALPSANHLMEVLTINYYDNYVDTDGMIIASTNSFGVFITNNLQSLPTVSKVRVLEPSGPVNGINAWVTTVTGYDNKARVIYVESNNPYLDTHDKIENLLDFIGKPIEIITNHTKGAFPTITTNDYFTYDHASRLLTHEQKIDSEAVQLIAENQYDNLGQFIRKKIGGETFTDGYTDITNTDVTTQGLVSKTENSNAWDAGLRTRGEIIEEGGMRFTVVDPEFKHYRVGLVNVGGNNDTEWRDFDFAIYIRASDNDGDGLKDVQLVIEGEDGDILPGVTYQTGDVFSIQYLNDQVIFQRNGNNIVDPIDYNNSSIFTGKVALYTPDSNVDNVELFGQIDKRLQHVDYAYNVRGWLTDINDVNSTSEENVTDLFNFRVNYNSIEGNATNNGNIELLYNGNIAQTIWKTANTDTEKRAYAYGYDDLNRLTLAYNKKGSGLDVNANNNVNNILYDKNGNILGLTRRGKAENNNSYPLWDDLQYSYNGNQLQSVTDSAPVTDAHLGFNDDSGVDNQDYIYDANGNMKSDSNKGITSIVYNHLNLPTSLLFGNIGQIGYIYDATGIKLKKIVTTPTTINDTEYVGNYIYLDGVLQFFSHPEGYVEPTPEQQPSTGNSSKSVKGFKNGETTQSLYNYVFQYTDHLGNIRLSYSDSDNNGSINSSEIIEESNYYPFGLKQKGYNYIVNGGNDLAQQWKFGGKEYQEDNFGGTNLNWYDFGARNYDPALGRWMNLDPLAEAMRRHSPYNYAFNSPMLFTDPDGMAPWIPNVEEDGSTTYTAEARDSAETLSSQYGLSQENAEAITGTEGDVEIAEGTKISGETVNNVTGSEVLKLDLNSKEGKSSQRRFNQFIFARDHSNSEGASAFLSTGYYSNTKYKDEISGRAKMNIDGESVNVLYNIPLYRSGTFDGSSTAIALSNAPIRAKPTSGVKFPNQANVELPLFHPDTGGRMGDYTIFINGNNSTKVLKRLSKDFPKYNYIRIPKKIKN